MGVLGGGQKVYVEKVYVLFPSPMFSTLFSKAGNRKAFRLQGAGGDHFHCTVEPSPGHIRCRHPDLFRFPRCLPICSDLHSL